MNFSSMINGQNRGGSAGLPSVSEGSGSEASGGLAGADLDFAEGLRLARGKQLQPDQFQHRQEGHDHFQARSALREQVGKLQARPFLHERQQMVDFLADGPSVFEHVARWLALR